MKYQHRLVCLLIAMMMTFSCMLPCFASAAEDWVLFNVIMSWTDAEGTALSVQAQPVESSNVEIFWAQLPEDAPLNQQLEYIVNHPDHLYNVKCVFGPGELLTEYPEQFSPDTANMIFQLFDPSDLWTPCDQLYVYFSTLPLPEEPIPCVGFSEESAEEPAAEQPTEVPAEEPAAEQPTEAPAEEPAAEQPTETPAEEPAAEQPTEAPAEEPAAEQPTEVPAEEPAAEQPTEVPAEEPAAEQPTEVPAEEPAAEPAETSSVNPEELTFPIWGQTATNKVNVRETPGGKQIAQIANAETYVWLIGAESKDSITWYHLMWEDTHAKVREGYIRSDLIAPLSQEDSDLYQSSLPSPVPVMTDAPITAEPVEEPAEEPTETPAEEPAAEPTEAPAEEPAEAPVEEPAEEPVEAPAEEPANNPEDLNYPIWGRTTAKKVIVRKAPAGKQIAQIADPETHVWLIGFEVKDSTTWYHVMWEDTRSDVREGFIRSDLISALSQEDSDAYQLSLPSPMPVMTPAPLADAVTSEEPAEPTEVPAKEPAAEPTEAPAEEPAAEPTEVPAEEPAAEPTKVPAEEPAAEPTEVPTEEPAAEPTEVPVEEPAAAALAKAPVEPTVEPTAAPTAEPTAAPTAEPTAAPTAAPTAEPTAAPTAEPTAAPTAEPTAAPTAEPTATPTAEPTAAPTAEPTAEPTAAPITGHARVIQDTTIHSTPNEKSVLLDPLTQEDVVVVLGQTVDQETDWTWHQIQYGSTTGYVRADTLAMMTDAEYSAYVNRTPEPTQTPEITTAPVQATAQAVLTAQPRSTWAGTPVPAVWVEAEEPTPVPTTFATVAPTETPQAAETAAPTEAPTAAPVVVTEAPAKAAGQSSTGILVGVAALVILICAAVGFVIYKRRRH